MMGRGLLTLILTSAALTGLYAFLAVPASSGMGYPGPGIKPSVLYFGGPEIYQDEPSVRTGSVGGPAYSGRGFRGGK